MLPLRLWRILSARGELWNIHPNSKGNFAHEESSHTEFIIAAGPRGCNRRPCIACCAPWRSPRARRSASASVSTIFTTGLPLMGLGAATPVGVMSGDPVPAATSSLIIDGHWEDTNEYGWLWVSNENWGDVTYHYGRWVLTRAKAGSGFLDMSGDPPGWCGVRAAAISAGFPCRPATIITAMAPIATFRQTNMAIATGTGPPSAPPSFCRSGFLSARIISAIMEFPQLCGAAARLRPLHFSDQGRDQLATVNNYVVNRSVDPARLQQDTKQRFPPVSARNVIGRDRAGDAGGRRPASRAARTPAASDSCCCHRPDRSSSQATAAKYQPGATARSGPRQSRGPQRWPGEPASYTHGAGNPVSPCCQSAPAKRHPSTTERSGPPEQREPSDTRDAGRPASHAASTGSGGQRAAVNRQPGASSHSQSRE